MNFNKMYGLFLRHFYLIKSSLPRILDLIYWPTIQIILWGFISKFFSIHSDYYSNTLGVILTCAILYDILFRSSISFNMLFLEEIWSRNFTNLFIAPLKLKEIIVSLNDRREFLAEVVGVDPLSDLAVLKIDGKSLPKVKIGKSEDVKVGDWVVAIGSPFSFDFSVTAGIISAKGRSIQNQNIGNYVPFIQTDVAINPGNSGQNFLD